MRQDNVHHQVEVDGHFVGGEHLHKRPEEVFTTAITKKKLFTLVISIVGMYDSLLAWY